MYDAGSEALTGPTVPAQRGVRDAARGEVLMRHAPLAASGGGVLKLFRTHPPTEERIARLRHQSVHSH